MGRLRYSINAELATAITCNSNILSENLPIYDPQMQVSFTGTGSHRVPAGLTNLRPNGMAIPKNAGTAYESNRAWMTSPRCLTVRIARESGTTAWAAVFAFCSLGARQRSAA